MTHPKMKTPSLSRIVFTLLLCVGLMVPMQVASFASIETEADLIKMLLEQMETAEWLFNPELNDMEYMDQGKTSFKSSMSGNTYTISSSTEDLAYATRTMKKSIEVDQNVKVADFVRLEVPKDVTLTVKKGATLTVYGDLSVKGKLVNNGTVIIGQNYTSKATDKPVTTMGIIRTQGDLVNNGSISIVHGTVDVEGGCILENKGTITISNKSEDLTGLRCGSIKKGGKVQYGQITSTGTVSVENKGGRGIDVVNGATFENKGKLYLTESGSILGMVTGDKPIAK